MPFLTAVLKRELTAQNRHYEEMWGNMDAAGLAACFTPDGMVYETGFDVFQGEGKHMFIKCRLLSCQRCQKHSSVGGEAMVPEAAEQVIILSARSMENLFQYNFQLSGRALLVSCRVSTSLHYYPFLLNITFENRNFEIGEAFVMP